MFNPEAGRKPTSDGKAGKAGISIWRLGKKPGWERRAGGR